MAVITLDSIHKKVLSVGNKEANQMYPPSVFDDHINVVTQWLIDRCVELYPTTKSIEDVLRPFIKSKIIPVVNGEFTIPKDYRNYLNLAVFVSPEYKGDCCDQNSSSKVYPNDPLRPSEDAIMQRVQRNGCRSRDVTWLPLDEFNLRTVSTYKRPTYQNPIATLEDGNTIKVCPFDISAVKLKYVRKAKEYKYGYVSNPDDTYTFDQNTTTESEWEDNAMQYVLKGMNTLFAAYTRDGEMMDWNAELKQIGLI